MRWKLFANRYNVPLLFLDILFSAYSFSEIKRRKKIIHIGQDYKKMFSTGDFYYNKKDFEISGSRTLKFILKKPTQANKLIGSCVKEGSSLINYAKQVENKDFKDLDKKDFLKIWQDIKNKYQDFAFWSVLSQIADAHLEQYLREKIILPKLKTAQFDRAEDEILSILIQPWRKTFIILEQEDLLKLVYWIKSNKLPLNSSLARSKIEDHLLRYSWINTHLWVGEAYSRRDLVKRIKRNLIKVELELNKIKQKESLVKREFELVVKGLKLSPKELKVIKIIQDIVFMRTYRTDVLSMTGYKFRSFFKFLAKEFNLALNDLMYLSIAEFEQVLKKWLVPDKIKGEIKKRRTSPFVYYWLKDKEKIIYKAVSKSKKIDVNLIKGKTA